MLPSASAKLTWTVSCLTYGAAPSSCCRSIDSNSIASALRVAHGGDESRQERAHALLHGGVLDCERLIEYSARVRHQQPAAEPDTGAQRTQHRQPCGLAERGAEGSRRGAHQCETPATEYPRDVGRRGGHPVDCLLEHPGNAVIV